MPKAQDMTPINDERALREAAITRDRIRVRGVIAANGDGYSGRYRHSYLRISVAEVTVQITASNGSPLGTARPGATVDLAVTMTGLVDLADNVYYGQRAQLLTLHEPED